MQKDREMWLCFKLVVDVMSHSFSIKWSVQHRSMRHALASVYDLVDISEVLEALQHLERKWDQKRVRKR